MEDTLIEIKNKVDRILTKESKAFRSYGEQEQIDRFLDSVNTLKEVLRSGTKELRKADELVSKVTWIGEMAGEDEHDLKGLIDGSLEFHRILIVNYAKLRREIWKLNVARKEISAFKDALDDFEESLFELDQIFFELRQDSEFRDIVRKIA